MLGNIPFQPMKISNIALINVPVSICTFINDSECTNKHEKLHQYFKSNRSDQAWKKTQGIPSCFLPVIFFFHIQTPIDSTNDQNICVELIKAVFTH